MRSMLKGEAAFARTFRAVAMTGLLSGIGFGQAAAIAATLSAPEEKAVTGQAVDGVGDIVVTAQRTSTLLQRTPVSVTALTAGALQARAIVNIQEVASIAPNLVISSGRTGPNVAFVYIRGIGQSDDNPAVDPGVAQYVDDVYLGRISGGLTALDDVERVEVLRGPQGTLYGKNALGGAISITTKRPSDAFEGRLTLRGGNYGYLNTGVMLNQPLTDDLAVRVSAMRERNSGYMANTFTGGRVNRRDFEAGRVSLLWRPASRVEILMSLDGSRDRSGVQDGRLVDVLGGPFVNAATALFGPNVFNPYVVPRGQNPYRGGSTDLERDPAFRTPYQNAWGASVRAKIDLGNVTLKSITSYRKLDLDQLVDIDLVPSRAIGFSNRLDQKQFSQEFQASGVMADEKLKWIAGLYYYNEDLYFNSLALVLSPTAPQSFSRDQFIKTDSVAGYANATYSLTGKLSLNVGVRYTSEKRDVTVEQYNFSRTAVQAGPATGARRFNSFTPRLGVQYQALDDILLFASYGKGFKSGGFNGRIDATGAIQPFQPESTSSYEVGIKSAWLDRKLTINIAGFYTDYRNLQLQVFTGSNGTFIPLTQNAGKARLKGIELETILRPVKGLSLYGNVGYLSAKYRRYQDALLGDLSAKRLVNAPKLTADVGASYEAVLSDRVTGKLNLDYKHQAKVFYDNVNSQNISQPAYGVLNARASALIGKRYEIGVWGKNLTNRIYYQNGANFASQFGVAAAYYGAPRTYGLDLSVKF